MTKIEWSDRTWNPLAGCSIVSSGCVHCYAMKQAFRLEHMGQEKYKGTTRKTESGRIVWSGKINLDEKALLQPLEWKKPQRVFVNSMSDLFHENVPFGWIDRVFAIMALTPNITYQVLTKRPDRMARYLNQGRYEYWLGDMGNLVEDYPHPVNKLYPNGMPLVLPNVWLGTTVENQEQADKRIPDLLNCPAAVRFVSCEPLLGPVDLDNTDSIHETNWLTGINPEYPEEGIGPKIHWVIAGGESGTDARPSHPDWFRSLRDQCKAAGVAFFFKQWGQWFPEGQRGADFYGDLPEPMEGFFETGTTEIYDKALEKAMARVEKSKRCVEGYNYYGLGKKAAGRLLDGQEWNQFPEGRNEGGNG